MAGIGFELRKLFQEQGLINNAKAYAYSSLTTVGPMVLCMFLSITLQWMMRRFDTSYVESELYVATLTYGFVFSIILTSGISMLLTRYTADMLFEKKYDRLLASYYGALIVCIPIGAAVAWFFLRGVSENAGYKAAAYLFFVELIVIWIQGVYLSALKDYMRIVRSFAIGTAASLLSGWLLLAYTPMPSTTAALLAFDIGFFIIALLSTLHFEHIFPRGQSRHYLEFLAYFKKYRALFPIGCFMYAGVYVHSLVYWFGDQGIVVANQYHVMPLYDSPVFYAFLSVIPTLVTFVVSVETSFYEKFKIYYKRILERGTYLEVNTAKKEMQKTLVREIGFLMEVQLLFTILSIALGMRLLPRIGFTMVHLDLFVVLVLGYFLFIMLFILMHILMYFDDRKGVLMISGSFVVINIVFSFWMMKIENHGLGMFIASSLALGAAIVRLLYVLRNIDYYTFCSQPLNMRPEHNGRKIKLSKSGMTMSVLVLVSVLLLAGCSDNGSAAGNADNSSDDAVTQSLLETGLTEDKRVYEQDQDDSVKTLYVTVLPDAADAGAPISWYSMNRLEQKEDNRSLEAIVQEGADDGKGPVPGMFSYGTDTANASITLRGRTAFQEPQKSYKLKLFDEAGLWQGQRTLNLNKHMLDLSRVRNKLSFDLMEQIPDLTSLRTQFVHLYVKDLSEGAQQAQYVDYGLYTQIEQPNEMFLKTHLLDPNGYLYKVAFFEFGLYPEIKSETDPGYDKAAFETILEIKGREEHQKLIDMLKDVNNPQIPIEEIIEKHFDLDNFLTWTAINILMDNMDTDANNYYLYSPLNSEKWYFLPWDYDGAWELQREVGSAATYQNGLSNYWGSILHNRYFRTTKHVQQLTDKLNELHESINKDTIAKQLELYKDKVKPFLSRAPEVNFLPGKVEDYDKELQQLIDTPERGLERYFADLEKPRPFYQSDMEYVGNSMHFTWDLSFDLQGDDLVYDVTVAKDLNFTQVIAKKTDLVKNEFDTPIPARGTYYWKVVVRDSKGNSQDSFDSYLAHDGTPYFGLRQFEVE
jgi:uncharacterized membrane protein